MFYFVPIHRTPDGKASVIKLLWTTCRIMNVHKPNFVVSQINGFILLQNLHSTIKFIKRFLKVEMDRTSTCIGETSNTCNILIGNPYRKRLHGRHRWIKLDLGKPDCEDVKWIWFSCTLS
jgi:hypothetical protein